jgi:hypothetical protein
VAARSAGVAATAIVVAVITYVTIMFGELVPKRIGQLYPESGLARHRPADALAGRGRRAFRQAAVCLDPGDAEGAGHRHHRRRAA